MSDRISAPSELAKSVVPRFADWLRNVTARGVAVLVYETYRSGERQGELYKVGRRAPSDDALAPLENWSRIDGERVLTNALPGKSAHQLRRAWDAVPWQWAAQNGEPASKLDWSPFPTRADERAFRWSGDLKYLDHRWRRMVEEAEALGITWAGRWTGFVEYVHFEVRSTKPRTAAEIV